ncbi:hypothetical protein [Ktedonospora formicarum]|uniref:Uncharacterized protein n=1 Tax=Ktedonospora formicarum TaxID=2778364 RepID=A0A8J3MV79_9CHLR|nr:hypothetical protein [Ktedonospora formicarum]GHO49030.1 hypothetical protein KSX_71930 [Ktedonospora formicarum]
MLNKGEQPIELLQQKPPRRQQKLSFAPFLLLIGGTVILGALLVGAWQVYTTNNNVSSNTERQSTGGKGNSAQDPASWDSYPQVYWQTLRTEVAQGLHMSEQQIQSNFQSTFHTNSSSNKQDITAAEVAQWLSNLANAHGVSQKQLHTLEVTAVQKAHTVLVNQHVLTQQQANENMRRLNNQDDLNMHIFNAFADGGNNNERSK